MMSDDTAPMHQIKICWWIKPTKHVSKESDKHTQKKKQQTNKQTNKKKKKMGVT